LENREIKYSLLNKKPCIFKDASGNISSVYDKLFGQKIDSSGNIVDSSGNILYFLGHIVDESGNKLDTTDIDLSGNVRDASGNFILCLDDVIDFSNNISDLSGSYIDSTGMVFDTSGNSFGPLNVMNQSGETVLHIFNYFNPLTTEDINNAFNLDQHFSSWQTYYNNSSCDLFFWGIKKSDDNNVITIDDLVGDNIEKITI
jgi:hypothetical protein